MVCTVQTFPRGIVRGAECVKRRRGNQGGKSRRDIKDIVCAFDIETTSLLTLNDEPFEHAIMYSWAFQLGLDVTITGRTWEEYRELIDMLCAELGQNESLVVFVHNLSFEFQFLRGVYNFDTAEVFAVKSRKILKCSMCDGKIEYRCSYLQTNMSLSALTKNMDVEHKKMDGDEYDYSRIRYPWTELTEKEWQYQIHDVLGLVESMTVRMQREGDTLYTIPLTSTGYVRRDAKEAMRFTGPAYVRDQFPDPELYEVLREAFRGGNTHANRYYTGMILNDVKSVDIASSYPAQQCMKKFPVTPFYHVDRPIDEEDLRRQINVRKKAVVARVRLWGVRLREKWWGFPYLSKDKCRGLPRDVSPEYIYDNGRVLAARVLETTITDIDLEIIDSEYVYDGMEVLDCYTARYGFLPKTLVQCTLDYFDSKTQLKGVDGAEYNYMRAKALLNSIYGMCAQDPAKDSIDFIEDLEEAGAESHYQEQGKPVAEILAAQISKAFLVYQWGVWITAHARKALEEGLALAGENAVYCDTDSVKYVEEVDFEPINAPRREAAKAAGASAVDIKGARQYMGIFEPDGKYEKFVTWGAKKYAYTCKDKSGGDKLVVTVAGVPKKYGAKFLAEHGGIEAFKPGFVFTGKAGGVEAVFNDDADFWVEVDGHPLHITRNVCLCPSTYKLGLTSEYESLIRFAQDGLDMPC